MYKSIQPTVIGDYRVQAQSYSKPGNYAGAVCMLDFVIRLSKTRTTWEEGLTMRNYFDQVYSGSVCMSYRLFIEMDRITSLTGTEL